MSYQPPPKPSHSQMVAVQSYLAKPHPDASHKPLNERVDRDRAMRRSLRKLRDKDPAAFDFCITNFQGAGEHWLRQLPPICRVRVDRKTLALLLADYRIRDILAGRKVKRIDWLQENARLGIRYGTAYSRSIWSGYNAIKGQLVCAEGLARNDPSFAAEVAAMAEILIEIGGSRSSG